MDKDMVTVCIPLKMEVDTKAIGQMVKNMVKVRYITLMEAMILVPGKMMFWLQRVKRLGIRRLINCSLMA